MTGSAGYPGTILGCSPPPRSVILTAAGWLRSRVSGAFQAVNYGTRPLGSLAGGALGTLIGVRPTLWIAAAGGIAGALLLLPSPVPGFRMPARPAQQ